MTSRVLYVTHRVPWPPDRGDRIRTWNILKFLAARSDVDLLCLTDEPVADSTVAMLQRTVRRLAIVPHGGKGRYVAGAVSLMRGQSVTEGMFDCRPARETLRAWAGECRWTAALASSSGVAQYLRPSVIGRIPRRWVDLIDVDSEKWFDYSVSARFPKSSVYRLEGSRLRATECRLARDMQRLLVVSEAECDVFRSFCPTPVIHAVANGVDTDYFCPAAPPPSSLTSPPTCVFVGVMNYLPNADAVRWFSTQVWPAVRSRFPDARFCIVGKSPGSDVQALGRVPGIEVTGSVADVRPWLHQAHCAVVPLRIARGIQNKVLEAMACGRPVVCSSAPLRGLNAEPGLHVLQADSADEWIETLTRLFRDPSLQQDIGLAASTWTHLHHGWDACLEPLHALTAFGHSSDHPEIEVMR